MPISGRALKRLAEAAAGLECHSGDYWVAVDLNNYRNIKYKRGAPPAAGNNWHVEKVDAPRGGGTGCLPRKDNRNEEGR